VAQEPSGLWCGGFSPPVVALLIPAFALRVAPRALAAPASPLSPNAPLPKPALYYADHTEVRPAADLPRLRDYPWAPWRCRRGATRPVSYYALFQGWLLLSQPPGCLCTTTTFPTQGRFGALSRRSGLLPSWRRRLAPATSLVTHRYTWAFWVWLGLVTCSRPRAHPVPYLPRSCRRTCARPPWRLYLHTFRGEPAISGFDGNFSSTHRSSPCFATQVGSGLDGVLPPLHPAHG